MRAIVSGANGFTGLKLVKRLLLDKDYSNVCILVRKKIKLEDPRLTQLVVDFEKLTTDDIPDCIDVAFCCLGTTIKNAQSKQNFRKVDYEYITRFAKVCEKCCVKDFHLISAIWASPQSYFFYQRVKGEAESFINSLNFESVVIYRPSVIYGKRKEFRLFESIAAWISRNLRLLFVGKLHRIIAVEGDQLAAKIHHQSKNFKPGRWIFESEEISSTL